MIQIGLNSKEYDYLCRAPFLKDQYRNLFVLEKKINGVYILKIPEDQADAIRDLCGEQLQIAGFNETYEFTPEGQILESLIDKFFIG